MDIAIVSLSACSGCQVSILDQKDILGRMLGSIKYATTILDVRELPKVDCCLVEGAVRTEDDLEKLKEAREKSELLVAIGSCSTYGGIQALGNLSTSEEILQTVSGEKENPFTEAPPLIPRLESIDKFVEVDYYIPGCPPSESVLQQALPLVLSGKEIQMTDKHRLPVCAECGRKIEHRELSHLESITIPDKELCLLSQGYVCLGSVTRGGCSAQCPDTNMPCSGCRGPTDRVLTLPTHTVIRDFVSRVSHFSGRSEEDVMKEISAIPWRFFPFTFASESMKRKPYSPVVELQAPLQREDVT
ncbi:MAG: NADH-quinone oxidoreductase subunit B family protein [Candidatus Thorarchaeota archaeon]|jgi:F420-non-reducing hydrogenase small subunit